MGVSGLTNLAGRLHLDAQGGLAKSPPQLVILGVILLRVPPMPDRGSSAATRFPEGLQPRHALVAAGVTVH